MDLEGIKKYLDEKFSALSAGLKPRASVTMKTKGNQAQANHATNMLSKLDEVEDRIRKGTPDEAVEALHEAQRMVNKRLKLVKIADKSEYGWDTVNEYTSDNAASDSDDDRKIRRAENAAAKKRKRISQPNASRKEHKTSSDYGNPEPSRFFRTPRGRGSYTRGGPSSSSTSRDRCFACGMQGHWRANCPRLAPQASSGSHFYSVKTSPTRN